MRIDSHQHFWNYDAAEYGWIGPDMVVLRRDFRPEHLAPNLEAHGFDGTVAVQARQSEEETRWLLELADRHELVRGVVGWVDLCDPNVGRRLDTLAHPKLRGVRHVLQDEADPAFMLRDAFRAGVGQLADRGMTYDLLVFPEHLSAAAQLAESLPQVPFVLDHIGKPPIRDGGGTPPAWVEGIRRLAGLPHVHCKVSGLVTEAAWQERRGPVVDATNPSEGFGIDEFLPYLRVIADAFGGDRLMFGSDWPVCLLATDYASVLHLAEIFVDQLEQQGAVTAAAVFGGNAARFYGLEDR